MLIQRALTGLNHKAFDALREAFSPLYKQSRQIQPRQRAVGGGRKAQLLGTQEKPGVIFDMHPSQAHEWMHRLQPILTKTLGKKLVLPERQVDSIEGF